MKKIIMLLLALSIFVVGCSKDNNSSYDKYLEEGKTAIANQEYEKGRNFFSLAKEANSNENEANVLYNQTNNLVEAITSKENKHYDVAIQLCNTILKMNSESNIVKTAANDLKVECEKLKKGFTEEESSEEEESKADANTQEEESKTDVDTNTQEKESNTVVDIRSDYANRLKEIEGLAVKMNGIFRYQEATINILRSYDTSNLQNAKVVYELSDELLNNLYNQLRNDLDESTFKQLSTAQVSWVKNKMEKEKHLNYDEVVKYQVLARMTLDKCEEWNLNYYK